MVSIDIHKWVNSVGISRFDQYPIEHDRMCYYFERNSINRSDLYMKWVPHLPEHGNEQIHEKNTDKGHVNGRQNEYDVSIWLVIVCQIEEEDSSERILV